MPDQRRPASPRSILCFLEFDQLKRRSPFPASRIPRRLPSFAGDIYPVRRPSGREETMVKITDKTNYSRFAQPTAEDEGIWLEHAEVHLVTHPVGQVKEMHTHDPPQDHGIVMRSGRMRWTVEDQSLDAEPGDVIVTAAAPVSALMILIPLAPASAGPYVTPVVPQASGTPSPPANGVSPFASCNISGFLIPGETNFVNTELEPWVAVNPTDSSNIIGVYQQDRYTFGGARGLGAAVTHNGGATWSSTYPPFTTCAGGTETNGGDFQRASDPWVTFSPNGDAYFISLSLTFVGPTSTTGTAVLVSKSTDGG